MAGLMLSNMQVRKILSDENTNTFFSVEEVNKLCWKGCLSGRLQKSGIASSKGSLTTQHIIIPMKVPSATVNPEIRLRMQNTVKA